MSLARIHFRRWGLIVGKGRGGAFHIARLSAFKRALNKSLMRKMLRRRRRLVTLRENSLSLFLTHMIVPRDFFTCTQKGKTRRAAGTLRQGFGGSHAGIHGLQSKSIGANVGRYAPISTGHSVRRQSQAAARAGEFVRVSSQQTESTYALVWSAASTSAAASSVRHPPHVPVDHPGSAITATPMPMMMMADVRSSASTTRRARRPQRSLAGVAALQNLSTVASDGGSGGGGGKLTATQLRTHGAVVSVGGAPSSSSGGGGGGGMMAAYEAAAAAADCESLRAAWRVTAGEFQSAATLSTVDIASTTASTITSRDDRGDRPFSRPTVGSGGHGVAFAGDVAYAPSALGMRASDVSSPAGVSAVDASSAPYVSFTGFVHGLFHDGDENASSSSSPQLRARVRGLGGLRGAVGAGGGAVLTGGGGGLGTLMTSWLVRSAGHRSVTVLGRSGRSKQLDAASMRDGAAVVRVVRCDVSASDEVNGVYNNHSNGGGGGGGGHSPQTLSVIHAGGVLADATVGNQSAGGFASALAPKVIGVRRVQDAWIATGGTQRVAVFSSIASLLGAAGQANYAAANGGLDRWAAAAQASGSPGVSAQWGAWGGAGVGGMAASDPGGVLSRMRRLGFGVLAPGQGLRALERMMAGLSAAVDSASPSARRHPVFAVSPFDAAQISKTSAAAPIGVIFAQLCADAAAGAAPSAGTAPVSVQSQADVAAEVKHVVSELAQSFIGDAVSPGETLVGAGLDSLGAVELRNALVSKLSVTLPGTLIFDYPTIDAIADYVSTLVKPTRVAVAAPPAPERDWYASPDTMEYDRRMGQRQQQPSQHPFADPGESRRRVSDLVETLLGEKPGDSQPLLDAGLDSLSAVELRNVLAAETGIAMPATVIFDYPSVSDLAAFITSLVPAPAVGAMTTAAEHADDSGRRTFGGDFTFDDHRLSAGERRRVASPRSAAMFIASTSGQLPGGVGGGGGGDAISRTPMARWHLDDCVGDGAAKPRFSAFVADVDCFDARSFDISAPELALMDAQQRLLLVSTTESLRTARLTSGARHTSGTSPAPTVGVYVGISSMDHQKVLDRSQSALSPFTATGGALSVAAGRVAFAHGLTGAAVAVDTACSSSLVALQVATASFAIRADASMNTMSTTLPETFPRGGVAACVAGVNLLQVPETTMMFQRAGMITPDGRCKALDASADGYTRGEACASVGL